MYYLYKQSKQSKQYQQSVSNKKNKHTMVLLDMRYGYRYRVLIIFLIMYCITYTHHVFANNQVQDALNALQNYEQVDSVLQHKKIRLEKQDSLFEKHNDQDFTETSSPIKYQTTYIDNIKIDWQFNEHLQAMVDDASSHLDNYNRTHLSIQDYVQKQLSHNLQTQSTFLGFNNVTISIKQMNHATTEETTEETTVNHDNNHKINYFLVSLMHKPIQKIQLKDVNRPIHIQQLLPSNQPLQGFDIQKAAENIYRLPGQKNIKMYLSDDKQTSILNIQGISQRRFGFKLGINNALDTRVEPWQIEANGQAGNLLTLNDLLTIQLNSNLRRHLKDKKYRHANIEWLIPYQSIDFYTRHNFYEMLRDDSNQPLYAKQHYHTIGLKHSQKINTNLSVLLGVNAFYKQFNGFSYNLEGTIKNTSALTAKGAELLARIFYTKSNHTVYLSSLFRLGRKNLQPSFDFNYLYHPYDLQGMTLHQTNSQKDVYLKTDMQLQPGYFSANFNQADDSIKYTGFIFGKVQATIGSYVHWKNQQIYASLTISPNISLLKKADSKTFESVDPANKHKSKQLIQLGAVLGIKGQLNVKHTGLIDYENSRLNYHAYLNLPFNSKQTLKNQWFFSVNYEF